MNRKTVLYVGYGLTLAPKPFHTEVDILKVHLAGNFDVLQFLGMEGDDSLEMCQKIFNHDIHACVERCEAMLAICDHPSTGLGWEMSVAHRMGVPLLAVAHRDSKVTRFIRGVPSRNFAFVRYDSMFQIPEILRRHIVECQGVQG